MAGFFKSAKKSAVEDLLNHYGTELPETREIDPTLFKGINLANSKNWEEAAAIFRQAQQAQPDYDVPQLWLADYLKQKGQIFQAIDALKESAEGCRRKHYLLENAAEFTLLNLGNSVDALHLFAQAISTMAARPARGDAAGKRPFLFMKAYFEARRDDKGIRWAESIIAGEFSLTHDMTGPIMEDPFVSIIDDLAEIRKYLAGKFPA